MLWPCFVLCAFMPSRTGGTGARICVERGVGGIVVVTLVTVEVWMSWWWNDRGHVGSGRGSRALVHYARSRPSHRREWVSWLGAPMAPRLSRGLHVSLGRGKSTPRGSGAPVLTLPGSGEVEIIPGRAQGLGALMTSWGLGRGENYRSRRLSHPRPFRKARAGWRLALDFERLTCCQRL
jgi:hypothetical protein